MMTHKVSDLIRLAMRKFTHLDRFQHEVRLIISAVIGRSESWVFANHEYEVPEEQAQVIVSFIERRASHEPLAKILGRKNFWKFAFNTTQATLDPRPDSEILVEAVLSSFLDEKQPFRILELGVGTGCLIMSILLDRPNAIGIGVDLSAEALAVAGENLRHFELKERLLLVQADWLEAIGGSFDCIISNPPYIPSLEINELAPDVKDFDPLRALDGGADGLDYYRRFFKDCVPSMLTTNGKVFFECGIGQKEGVIEKSERSFLNFSNAYKDLQGIARVLEFCGG